MGARRKSGAAVASKVKNLIRGKLRQVIPPGRKSSLEIKPIDKRNQRNLDNLAKSIIALKNIETIIADFKSKLKKSLLSKWAKQYAAEQDRPKSIRYTSTSGQSIVHVVTTAVKITEDKQAKLLPYGIDLENYKEISSVRVDYGKLGAKERRAFTRFLSSLDSPEETAIFSHRASPELINNLSSLVKKTELETVVKILDPETRVQSPASKKLSGVDCIDFIKGLVVPKK